MPLKVSIHQVCESDRLKSHRVLQQHFRTFRREVQSLGYGSVEIQGADPRDKYLQSDRRGLVERITYTVVP